MDHPEAARREVQYMRHRYMGIMVGIGTVLADDPMLNVRVEGLKSPVRIICDSKLRIPLDSQIVKSAREYRTIVAYADLENVEKKKEILQTMGVETVFCPDMKKHVNLKHLMEYLGKENIDSILLEGGGTLNDSALRAGVVQEVQAFIAPKNLWRSRKPDSGGWNWDRASVSGSGTKVQRYLPDWRRPKNYLSGLKKRTGGIMFTGIVEEVGKVRYIQLNGNSGVLAVKAAKVLEGTKIGDSIAVNGVCLTVTSLQPDGFTADVMAETIRRSSLGNCKIGSYVNLERAMAADGRFGGHIVSGHIDGTGVIRSMIQEENAVWVSIKTSQRILDLIVEKGSVCIDGISLTVAKVDDEGFQVSVIPHTGEETILLKKASGDLVNLENDIIGKYVEKLMGIGKKEESKLEHEKKTGITMEFLEEFGF